MSVHLITGYKGKEHIQSKDARSFNAAMFGAGEFVMEIGEQIGASITNNNTVRVLDGDILMQGAHIRIETGTYEDLTVTTGTAGKKRIDLIVMTYEKDASQGTELAFLEVIKGTETEGTASVPEYTTGVLSEGALKNQMPLYKVEIEGVVLSTIEPLFKTIPTYKTLAEKYAAQFEATINALKGADILDTIEEIQANTQGNMFAGALGVKEGFAELNNSLTYKKSGTSAFYGGKCEYNYYAFGLVSLKFNGDITLPSEQSKILFTKVPSPSEKTDLFVPCADNSFARLAVTTNGEIVNYTTSKTISPRGTVMYLAVK